MSCEVEVLRNSRKDKCRDHLTSRFLRFPLVYLSGDMGNTDLVLRESCSLDQPLRESETLSVYDGEDLDYLMRQHTPWYRHVYLLGHSVASPVPGYSACRREAEALEDEHRARYYYNKALYLLHTNDRAGLRDSRPFVRLE
jgi:hypothetical protein